MRGVVTGKDVRIGGSEGRGRATGQGVVYCIEEWCRNTGRAVAGLRFIVQGFGNVGSAAAEILTGLGAHCVAVQDADGSLYDPNGLNVAALMAHVAAPHNLARSVRGFAGGQVISASEFWAVDADICIPAALGNAVGGNEAERLKVKLVAEGANRPLTTEADAILAARGIDVIPDIIANAGGVIVSYYEWIQNKRMEHWSLGEVNARLERAIKSNYGLICDIAANRRTRNEAYDSHGFATGKAIPVRMAAMVLALKRIEAHYMLEGFSQ
jgi:glutamate dehydrogenase (NAD(P)+)